jgi:hypothetical protein
MVVTVPDSSRMVGSKLYKVVCSCWSLRSFISVAGLLILPLPTGNVNIVLEVRDNEHSLLRPTDRGNDPTVDNDETERVDRERGRDGNGLLHGDQWTLYQGWISLV